MIFSTRASYFILTIYTIGTTKEKPLCAVQRVINFSDGKNLDDKKMIFGGHLTFE